MTDASTPSTGTPPDHLSNDPRSKFHEPAALERGIGIRFNGVERHNVGKVEAWFLDATEGTGAPDQNGG